MISHYLQTAWRHYLRNKFSTIANVLCLAFGITCFLCAYSFFAFFASAESGFKNASRIYTVKTELLRNNEKDVPVTGVPYFIAKNLKDDLPEFKDISLASGLLGGAMPRNIVVGDKHYDGMRIMAADDAFLRLFDIPFLGGNRVTALSAPDGVVISKRLADILFGTSNVVGKRITFNPDVSATITGVTDSIPEPSHLTMMAGRDAADKPYLDVIASWDLFHQLYLSDVKAQGGNPESISSITDNNPVPDTVVYLLSADDSFRSTLVNARLQSIVDKRIKGKNLTYDGDKVSYLTSVVPVKESLSIFMESTSKLLGMPLVTLLTIFGTVILAVAIANYINLYTTQVIAARKEMGTQRLLGATRTQIIVQCMIETSIVCIAALSLAQLLFQPIKGFISSVSFVKFNISWMLGWRFMLAMLILTALVSFLSALYPIIITSRVAPLDSLHERSGKSSHRLLTQLLVAVQFSVAGIMLVLLVVIQQQRNALQQLALGNMKDPVVIVEDGLNKNGIDYHTFVNQMSRHASVKNVAMADGGLWGVGFSFDPITVSEDSEAATRRIRVDARHVSSNFFAVMNISLLAGHDFSSDRDVVISHAPSSAVVDELSGKSDENVIVDKNLIGLLGSKNAEELIGKKLAGHGSLPGSMRIIGVVDNAYQGIGGTHNEGTVFLQSVRDGKPIIQIDKHHITEALSDIDATLKELAPTVSMHHIFADEYYAMNGPGIFNLFTIIVSFLIILAIAIAVMGMAGIASHTIIRRTREISIRKSLGASSIDIYKLLLKYFAIPVAIATTVIAWPLGWLVSRAFLNLFPYRASIGFLPFILSVGATVSIALLAVSAQSIRAARRNPADVLRYE
jgi:putative ABC transport system permease protein